MGRGSLGPSSPMLNGDWLYKSRFLPCLEDCVLPWSSRNLGFHTPPTLCPEKVPESWEDGRTVWCPIHGWPLLRTLLSAHSSGVSIHINCCSLRVAVVNGCRDTYLEVSLILLFICSWDLTSSSGKGWGRQCIKGSDNGSQVEGIQKTQSLNNGERLTYPPSTQEFQPIDITWSPLLG